MLTPRYLESAPDAMVDLYSEVEADILADMARRIARYDFFIPAAEHQLRVLEEMGAEQTYILRRLAELTGRSEAELRQLFEVSGGKALVSDQADYRRAGLHPPALNTSQELQQVLSAGLRQTQGLFTNLTRTTALDSGERFRAVLDRAWLQVSTGGFDANTAIRNAIKELTRQGLTTVDYASGRTMSVEAAVRMNVVTGVNQTALRLQDTLADEMDSDLVETTAHSGARPSHARWQGQVFSRSGKSKKYPDFRRATGYGTGPGLGGWNCRHSFHPYFDGMARTYGAKELKKLEAKSITYNGEKLTEYEASQRQRLGVAVVAITAGIAAMMMAINSAEKRVNQMNAATQQSLSPSTYGGVSGRSASIPALATGAVIPPNGEFLAVLGDQKKGRNLEAPENLIRQIVREESGGGLSGTLTIRPAPGLTRYLAYELKREDARAGTPLVEGTRR